MLRMQRHTRQVRCCADKKKEHDKSHLSVTDNQEGLDDLSSSSGSSDIGELPLLSTPRMSYVLLGINLSIYCSGIAIALLDSNEASNEYFLLLAEINGEVCVGCYHRHAHNPAHEVSCSYIRAHRSVEGLSALQRPCCQRCEAHAGCSWAVLAHVVCHLHACGPAAPGPELLCSVLPGPRCRGSVWVRNIPCTACSTRSPVV
jgi:hypothetical protein